MSDLLKQQIQKENLKREATSGLTESSKVRAAKKLEFLKKEGEDKAKKAFESELGDEHMKMLAHQARQDDARKAKERKEDQQRLDKEQADRAKGALQMKKLIGDGNALDVEYNIIKNLYDKASPAEKEGIMEDANDDMMKLYITWYNDTNEETKREEYNTNFFYLDESDDWGYVTSKEWPQNIYLGVNVILENDDKMKEIVKDFKERKNKKKKKGFLPTGIKDKRWIRYTNSNREDEFDFIDFPYFPPIKGLGEGEEQEMWDGKCNNNIKGCEDRQKLMNDWFKATTLLKKKVEERKEKFNEWKANIKYPLEFFKWEGLIDAKNDKNGRPINPTDVAFKNDWLRKTKAVKTKYHGRELDEIVLKWIKLKTEKKEEGKKGGRKRTRRKKRRRRRKSTKKKRRRKRKRTKKKRRRRR